MKLLIIDNYDSFTYNLVQLVEKAGVGNFLLVKNDQLAGLKSGDFDKVLISPGPGIANEAGELLPFLKQFMNSKSFLGICLGYEAIAEVCGGKLIQLPEPMHGIRNHGKVLADARLNGVGQAEIFRGLPREFFIGHYHSWIIEKESFPAELESTLEDENGLIMAFRHRQLDLRGLQFHPESVMTEFGFEMVRNWLEL
ncbi:MAG: aminodeoxychorismate/anthranilate synthase component II [Bacteroidales bacterium]|nr:aminodeoxychorismate/anthranilate synthase component II [Bacteroidales bacterium]